MAVEQAFAPGVTYDSRFSLEYFIDFSKTTVPQNGSRSFARKNIQCVLFSKRQLLTQRYKYMDTHTAR